MLLIAAMMNDSNKDIEDIPNNHWVTISIWLEERMKIVQSIDGFIHSLHLVLSHWKILVQLFEEDIRSVVVD